MGKKALRMGSNVAKQLDRDKDTFISMEELEPMKQLAKIRYLNKPGSLRTAVPINQQWAAADVVRYHDEDGDGKLTLKEFANGFASWAATEKEVLAERALEDIHRKAKAEEQETKSKAKIWKKKGE